MQSLQDVLADYHERVKRGGNMPWETAQAQPLDPDDGLPDCATCQNLRVVRYDVDLNDPRFGKVFPCPDCGAEVAAQRRLQRYRENLSRIDRYGIIPKEDATFESLDLQGRPESLRLAQRAALRFAQSAGGLWLVLWGPVGTGKTHLAMAVANVLRERQKTVLLADAPGLLDMLRSGYDDGAYAELLEIAQSVDYLLIDDLGTEKGTAWAQEKLFQVINHRYNQAPPAALMITMNETPQQALTRRLASRVMDNQSRIVHVTGSDYRMRRHGQ